MLTFVYYLLKVVICSGILYGYYFVALRNKVFHRWNRFYLLVAVTLSLVAPLIKINIFQNSAAPQTQAIHLIQLVNTGDEFVYEYSKSNGFNINATNLSIFCYILISGLLLVFLIRTLMRINNLKHRYKQTIVEGINFINTDARGTPFSFFKNIFWNNKIDLNTAEGKQIFQHELAHVQEKHTYDKVFMNVILIFFWCNPVFWLVRKELNMIHEFIADNKAIEDNDAGAFAAMILQATYPEQQFNITNNFFYSPLKRRLSMLTKNNNPKINYLSRLLVLPLAALVFFAFTLKMKTNNASFHYKGKKITVVIDAAHGGYDNGWYYANNYSGKSRNWYNSHNVLEKDIDLAIAKKIKELNNNESINIIFTRTDDIHMNATDRKNIAIKNNADLLITISLAQNVKNNNERGWDICIPGQNSKFPNQSKAIGTLLYDIFNSDYKLPAYKKNLLERDWLLTLDQCPSVMIQPGHITNTSDFEYFIEPDNQNIIAQNILNAIERYAANNLLATRNIAPDTVPENRIANNKNNTEEMMLRSEPDKPLPLYIVDGKEIPSKELDKMNPNNIERIDVLKGEQAIKKYGYKGKNGVVKITTHDGVKQITNQYHTVSDTLPKTYNKNNTVNVPIYDSTGKQIAIKMFKSDATDKEIFQSPLIFTQTETPPQFPGGDEAWKRYIMKVIQNNASALLKDNASGTCRVRFIVDVDGTVSNVEALTMKDTKLGEISLNAIKKGPKWVPAQQNGHTVAAYKEQPVTFTIAEN